jgi:hypothetical protein
MFVRERGMQPSHLAPDELMRLVNEMAYAGEYRDLPSDLRESGVHRMWIVSGSDHTFRIRCRGGWLGSRSWTDVIACCRVIGNANGSAGSQLQFEVGAESWPVWFVLAGAVVLGSIYISTSIAAGRTSWIQETLIGVLALPIFLALGYFRTGMLATRSAPSLVRFIRHLASGTIPSLHTSPSITPRTS